MVANLTLKAREVVIIITGAHKALALQKCIEGGVNHMWTLSSLQLHPHSLIVVDEDATLELQVKTVKVSGSLNHPKQNSSAFVFTPLSNTVPQYFKSIEAVANEIGYKQTLPSAAVTGAKRDMIVEELTSPRDAKRPDSAIHLKAPELTARPRSVTPELVPDRMSSRIPETIPQLDGSVPDDVPMQRMSARIEPLAG